jgi:hypothetical protein
MLEPIITASCSLASALLVAVMNNSLIKYRLDALEKRMDKHASMDDRLIRIETEVSVLSQHMKEIERRSEHE